MHNPGFYKRMRPAYLPLPPNKRAKYFSFRRPRGYKQSQSWQDWRAMKLIASRPLKPNLRTGGYVGKELKFVDYAFNGSVSNTWAPLNPSGVGCLNAVAQGAGESERIGRKITNHSLHIRGVISMPPTTALARTVRIIIVKDTQTNGAQLSASSVIAPSGVSKNYLGWRNLEHVSRFQVLMDNLFVIQPDIASDGTDLHGNSPMRNFNLNVKCAGTTLFDDPTAQVSSITDNSYHIIACASAGGVSLEYNCRFRYMG